MTDNELKKFVITDGNFYIYKDNSGKYVRTSSSKKADRFFENVATNILESSISKEMRNGLKVSLLKQNKDILEIKSASKKDIQLHIKTTPNNPNLKYWVDKLNNLDGLKTEIATRKKELSTEISQLDKELTDINHYIENINFDGCRGYKLSKAIQIRRRKKREVQDELSVLQYLDKNFIGYTGEKIESFVRGLGDRTYNPRVLEELFS